MDKLKQHIQDNLDKLDVEHPKEGLWNALSEAMAGAEGKDLLKDHLEEFADELEVETPGEHTWSQIKQEINDSKQVRNINSNKLGWYVAAASAVLLIVVSILFYKSKGNKDESRNNMAVLPGKDSSGAVKQAPTNTTKETAASSAIENEQKSSITVQPPGDSTLRQEAVASNAENQMPGQSEQKIIQAEKREPLIARKYFQRPPEPAQMSKRNNSYFIDKDDTLRVASNNKMLLGLMQAEAEYDNLIAGQVSLVQSTPIYGESIAYYESFISDFKRLDSYEKELRKTIMRKGIQENTLDELALIYQQKLTVLKMLQREINKGSSGIRNETDTIPVFIKL